MALNLSYIRYTNFTGGAQFIAISKVNSPVALLE